MSQFEIENEQAFQIVHDNPRRRGVIMDIGYIINQEQAQRFVEYEAAQDHSGDYRGMVVMVIAILVVICITVVAFLA